MTNGSGVASRARQSLMVTRRSFDARPTFRPPGPRRATGETDPRDFGPLTRASRERAMGQRIRPVSFAGTRTGV
jgi:hypothetical protein